MATRIIDNITQLFSSLYLNRKISLALVLFQIAISVPLPTCTLTSSAPYRTPTGVIAHETCTDNFLYRPKHVNNSFSGCEIFTLNTDAL